MPPPKASVVFTSRLSDDDPAHRYMDLFIALSVLEKLEVSYSKSLLSLDEYKRELEAGVNQAHKAHRLVSQEFPTFEDFARDFGCHIKHPVGHAETHEFQRAIMQLEGGQDLIHVGERKSFQTNNERESTAKVTRKVPAKDLLAIWEAVQVIIELIEAYQNELFQVQAGRVRCELTILMECVEQLDELILNEGSMSAPVQQLRNWQASLADMESRDLIDSKKLAGDVERLKKSMGNL